MDFRLSLVCVQCVSSCVFFFFEKSTPCHIDIIGYYLIVQKQLNTIFMELLLIYVDCSTAQKSKDFELCQFVCSCASCCAHFQNATKFGWNVHQSNALSYENQIFFCSWAFSLLFSCSSSINKGIHDDIFCYAIKCLAFSFSHPSHSWHELKSVFGKMNIEHSAYLKERKRSNNQRMRI